MLSFLKQPLPHRKNIYCWNFKHYFARTAYTEKNGNCLAFAKSKILYKCWFSFTSHLDYSVVNWPKRLDFLIWNQIYITNDILSKLIVAISKCNKAGPPSSPSSPPSPLPPSRKIYFTVSHRCYTNLSNALHQINSSIVDLFQCTSIESLSV